MVKVGWKQGVFQYRYQCCRWNLCCSTQYNCSSPTHPTITIILLSVPLYFIDYFEPLFVDFVWVLMEIRSILSSSSSFCTLFCCLNISACHVIPPSLLNRKWNLYPGIPLLISPCIPKYENQCQNVRKTIFLHVLEKY